MVACLFENQGIGGDGLVPNGALQDGAKTSLPEVLSRKDGAPTGSAAGCRYKAVQEKRTLPGNPVEVRGIYERVDRVVALEATVCAGIASPVVCKRKDYVWPVAK